MLLGKSNNKKNYFNELDILIAFSVILVFFIITITSYLSLVIKELIFFLISGFVT
jgi:hypothetical protein